MPIQAEVIEVVGNSTNLDPVAEVAEVQRMINAHNTALRAGNAPHGIKPWHIKRTVLYTGYFISAEDTKRLLETVDLPSTRSSRQDDDIRTLANSIMITPRLCTDYILDKVGGIGKTLRWRVVATGVSDNKLWAARVEPVPSNASYYTENPVPSIVLALRNNSRPFEVNRIQNWQPLPEEKVFEFETKVGEKVQLRIEEEISTERHRGNQDTGAARNTDGYEHPGFKRFRPQKEEFPALGSSQEHQNRNYSNTSQQQPYHNGNDENRRQSGQNPGSGRGGGTGAGNNNNQRVRGSGQRFERSQRGGGGGGRGAGRGGGAPGGGRGGQRGRGGYGSYRSLDDRVNGNGQKGSGKYGYDGARDDGGLTY